MKVLGRVGDRVLGVAAATVLFAMMMLTSVDVLLRYVFNAPLRGAFEVTELLMAVLIFCGLPLVSRRDEHVTVDFAGSLFPAWMRSALHVMVQLACAALMFGAGWLLWVKAGKVAQYGDNTATLRIGLAPWVYLMSVLLAFTGLVHLVRAFGPPPERDSDGVA